MKRAYVDIPEGQIHYRIEGTGKVILLLHMGGSSSGEYRRVIPFLSTTHRAIAMDFLGFGESDPAPRAYDMADHAMTVISFMNALEIKKASIVGHHIGALVGVEIAATHPERVDKLVLSSLPFFRDEKERDNYASKPVLQPVEMKPDGSHLMAWWRRAARYGDPMDIVDERVLDMHKAGARGGELQNAGFAYAANLTAKLPLIKCPTLLLVGGDDHWRPMQSVAEGLIARSKLVVIDKGPVYIARLMPKEFAETILDFLKSP